MAKDWRKKIPGKRLKKKDYWQKTKEKRLVAKNQRRKIGGKKPKKKD